MTFTIVPGDGRVLGDAEVSPASSLTSGAAAAVAAIVAGRAGTPEVAAIASYGVGFIVVTQPVAPSVALALDGVPGLSRLGEDETGVVWRVTPSGARVRIVTSSGQSITIAPVADQTTTQVDTTLPTSPVHGAPTLAQPSASRLVLAEAADPGWHASLNGTALPSIVVNGWAQGFQLPAATGGVPAGHLTVTFEDSRGSWLTVQLVLVLVVVLLALPTRRRSGLEHDPGDADVDVAPTSPRSSRPERARPRGGRMNRPRPVVLLGAASACVVVAVGLAAALHPVAPTTSVAAVTRQVSDVSLVCGFVPGRPGTSVVVSAAADQPGHGRRRHQHPQARPASHRQAADHGDRAVTVRRRWWCRTATGGPMVIHATGAMARGLTGLVSIKATSGAAEGLQSQTCTAPSNDSWFVGGGAGVGRSSALVLSNPSSAPSTVDLTVYGAKGASQPSVGQGITVPGRASGERRDGHPHPRRARDRRRGPQPLRAASRRCSSTTRSSGSNPGGVDGVPPAAAPATSVVVPGIPGDADARRALALVVPGSSDAVVRVRVSTNQGLLSPPYLSAVEVPGGPAHHRRPLAVRSGRALLLGHRVRPAAGRRGPDPHLGAWRVPGLLLRRRVGRDEPAALPLLRPQRPRLWRRPCC